MNDIGLSDLVPALDAKPRFALGTVVATPGAYHAIINANDSFSPYLERHMSGDWGDLNDYDKGQNELSVEHGLRVLSSYVLEDGVKIWVITEADRSVTTMLLPEEY